MSEQRRRDGHSVSRGPKAGAPDFGPIGGGPTIVSATGHVVPAGGASRHGPNRYDRTRRLHGGFRHGLSYPVLGFRNAFRSYRHCYGPYRRHLHRYGYRHHGHYGIYAYYGYPGFRGYYFDDFYRPYYGTHTTVYLTEPTVEVYEKQVVVESSSLPEEVSVAPPMTAAPSYESGTTQPDDSTDTAQPPVNPWLDHGGAAFAAGRYDEARSLFLQAVFADEADGFAKLLYGLASFAQGDYRLAAVAVRRALAITPELIDNPVDLRGFYPNADTLDGHVDALADSLEDRPLDANGLFLLGYLRYATGQPQKAYDALRRAVEADPTDELAARVSERAKHFADLEVGQSGTAEPLPD